ncbi:MAG: hypothetical protein IMZ47_08240, partial [Firmicutes bacterium]|nr:hypothetical protein [Bacillota bacterium]
MVNAILTPEEYAALLKSAMGKKAQSNERLQKLLTDLLNSMKKPKKNWNDVGSVLNEETAMEPLIVRKALAIKRKLETVPVDIWEGQLIPGSIAFYKKGLMVSSQLPEYAAAEELTEAAKYGLSVGSIVGHIVPDYPKILRQGVSGIQDEAHNRLQVCESHEQKDFYNAVIIALDGLMKFSQRYALLCKQEAQSTSDMVRQQELLNVAADLEHSPLYPPNTFRQAVYTIWITHIAFQLTGNDLAVGRLDQHLAGYLETDLQQGRVTLEEAQELMDCLFIKFNERALDNRVAQQIMDQQKIQQHLDKQWSNRSPFDHSTQKYNVRDSIDATNHWLQNVIVGGILP